MYKCDRCDFNNKLDINLVQNKQDYISPYGCYGGDYYVDMYFWFPCICGRALKVNEKDLSGVTHLVPKDYSKHVGVCTQKDLIL